MNLIKEHFNYLTQSGKYPGIDILRAIAVSVVLLYHFNKMVIGWIGVDLFFVISGFLIGGILIDQLQSDQWDLKKFYKNRFLRILPLYYFFIFLCLVVRPFVFPEGIPFGDFTPSRVLRSLFCSLAFMQQAGPHYFGWHLQTQVVPGGSWSLTIEEFFYLIFPICFYYLYHLCQKRTKILMGVLSIIWASAILVRIASASMTPEYSGAMMMNSFQFHSRYDELLAGVIAAMAIREFPKMSLFTKEILFIAGVFLLCLFLTSFYNSPNYLAPQNMTVETFYFPTVFGLAFAFISIAIANVNCQSMIITFLARISYSAYLAHIFVIEVASPFVPGTHVVQLLLLGISLVFAYVLSLCVEYPFIRLYKNKGREVRVGNDEFVEGNLVPAK
jgi:peptidoglycan/LPS O-acetylase OafA/YrhL